MSNSLKNSFVSLIHRMGFYFQLAKARKYKAQSQEISVRSTCGYQLHGMYHHPTHSTDTSLLICSNSKPAVSLSPSLFTLLGYNVLQFDPSGRGKSWGNDDDGGPEHQDNVACMLDWLQDNHPKPTTLVLSVGDGIMMATGGIIQSKSLVHHLVAFNPTLLSVRKGRQYDQFYHEERDLERLFPQLNCGYLHFTNTHADKQAATIWQFAQASGIAPSQQYDTSLKEQEIPLLRHLQEITTSEFLLLKQLWKIQQLTMKV